MQRLVDNSGSHPSFSTRNLLIAFALRWVQGRGGVYYCGSYTTPGNGHDLSLLSGLCARFFFPGPSRSGRPCSWPSAGQARLGKRLCDVSGSAGCRQGRGWLHRRAVPVHRGARPRRDGGL